MKTIIVSSLNDAAGTNIRERLIDGFDFRDNGDVFDSSPIYELSSSSDVFLATSRKDIVFVNDLDEKFGPGVRYVFVSRHYAESGIPSLTAHFTGNFGPTASFGGNPREIARYSPSLLRNYMVSLNSRRSEIPASYNITLEATHHGPSSLGSSVLFVELGSAEAQWRDTRTARFIAESLIEVLASKKSWPNCGIGIGGTHYPDRLNKMLVEDEISLGPVVPKYALEYLDSKILNQILEKGDQKISLAFIDQKGLGKFKQKVLNLLDEFGLEKVNV